VNSYRRTTSERHSSAARVTLKIPYEHHRDYSGPTQQTAGRAGTRPIDIAKSSALAFADAAIVARVDGELYDLTRPLEKGTPPCRSSLPRIPSSLNVYRIPPPIFWPPPCSELYPETKLGIGPPIDNGFYYDFDRPAPFTPEGPRADRKENVGASIARPPYERIYTRKDEGLKKSIPTPG